MRVVPRRAVVADIDQRFGGHQSHVNCVSSVYGIYVSGQLSRDVIGCFSGLLSPGRSNHTNDETPGFKPFTVLQGLL